jgi:hypothetical protein
VSNQQLLLHLGTEARQSLHRVVHLIEQVGAEPLPDSHAWLLSRCKENAHQLLRMTSDLAELYFPFDPLAENHQ